MNFPSPAASRKVPRPGPAGFSLVEILVASTIAAMVVGASVAVLGAISVNQEGVAKLGTINIGEPAVQALGLWDGVAVAEGEPSPGIRVVPFAPSFGLTWEFEQLRSEFFEDISHSVAVFCLPRASNSAYRTVKIPTPSEVDARAFAEPGAFAQHLNAVIDSQFPTVEAAALHFPLMEAVPPRAAKNVSVYMLSSHETSSATVASNAEHLRVFAIYELDFIPVADPAGTYVCLKRWVQSGSNLVPGAAPIEIFYPARNGVQSFEPAFVEFSRRELAGSDSPEMTVEAGNTFDRDIFKVAENKPFYFVWWPDPTDPNLSPLPAAVLPTYAAGDPRKQYASMMGRTANFFVVPMFPAL